MSKVNLTEICNITTGKLDSNAAEENGKYPYFTCAPEPLAINTYAFDDNVILLAGNNASGNFHCQRYKGKFNAYQRTYVITAKDGYDIDYIYYNLKINLAHLKKIAQGSQTKFLTMQILDGFKLEDVGLEEQKRLSKILSKIDNKIELNNKINAELEAMAKTLYDYWFLQFEFPNEEGKPYKSSGGKMVWNEELKREIPDGWEVKNIEELCDIIDCLHSKKPNFCYENEKYYLLTLENLSKNGYIDISNKFYISKVDYKEWTSRIEVQENDFVVTNAGRAGDICKIPKGIKCAIGRNLTAIRPKHIDAVYLFYYLKSSYTKKQIAQNLDCGSFFMSFNVKSIKKLNVLLPCKEVTNNIIKTIKPMLEKIENNMKENQELVSLRDFLLPLLMNGQVGFKE